MGIITDPTQGPLLDWQVGIVRALVPQLIGEVTSAPALKHTDARVRTYACDVKISTGDIAGLIAPGGILTDVPIAAGSDSLLYSIAPGSAVVLTRSGLPFAGRLEITDLSKSKPGGVDIVAVDITAKVAAAPVDMSVRVVALTLGQLSDPTFGGGFGVIPLGASAVYQGSTLLEVRA